MHVEERGIPVQPQAVRAAVRLRLPDAAPDESMFFLLAVVAGGICGYIVALL